MKRIVAIILSVFSFGCSSLYYGYLPGSEYQIYKNESPINLNHRKFNLILEDVRNENPKWDCSPTRIDRHTELEGDLGMQLLNRYYGETIPDKNGVLSPKGENVKVRLEYLSFYLEGKGSIKVYGMAQIEVTTAKFTKRYCSIVSDRDENAPLKWYSFDTRKGASRKMSSWALHSVIDQSLKESQAN